VQTTEITCRCCQV